MPARGLDADVAVIGAGPSGAASALFAARAGRRVILIDQETFPRDKPCGEGLMPNGRSPLRELGLDSVIAANAPSLEGIKLGLPGAARVEVPFPHHDGGAVGLGIRRLQFDEELIEAVSAEPRIDFHQQTRALDLDADSDSVTVLTSGGDIRARHVAVADGLRSPIRHRLGWTVGPRPPHRYGIVGHWAVDGPPDPWVQITFEEGFEIYEGPVPGGQRMVGVLCYQDRMREFAGDMNSRYRALLTSLQPELRNADQVDVAQARGPFWYRASTVADRGIFLVGDAAGFTDPITAEGIATGLRQARAFARALDRAQPERYYRSLHRQLTANPRRVATLFLRLTRTRALLERSLRSAVDAPQILPKLLGIGFGYWGFSRVTPREWIRILTGR